MDFDTGWTILFLISIVHISLAFFASVEISDYPLFSKFEKVKWQLIVWLVPIVGTLLAHRKLGIGWVSKSTSGGDTTTGGHNSSGCDGGGNCE